MNYLKRFLAGLMILMVFLTVGCGDNISDYENNIPVSVYSDAFTLYNNKQDSLQLCVFNGVLYCWTGISVYRERGLYYLNGKNLTRIELNDFSDNWVFWGFSRGYAYFLYYPDGVKTSSDMQIYSYSLEHKTMEFLLSYSSEDQHVSRKLFFAADGTLYCPEVGCENYYYPILDGKIGEPISVQNEYQLGDRGYRTVYGFPTRIQYTEHNQDDFIELPGARDRLLLPTNDGIIVYNKGYEHLLYLIHPDGDVGELFYAPCYKSVSAINVYEDYAFFSVKRYDVVTILGFDTRTNYSNDTISGSYRIDLKTGALQKCSEDTYCSLYIFGDNNLVGVTEQDEIVFMDFDYQIIDTLKP